MTEIDVGAIHESVLHFLLQHDKQQEIRFTLRKSDQNKRLSSGYWFHGNESYVAVSFWSGIDWQSKVPNIAFTINLKTLSCYLQCSAKDSVEKDELIKRFFVKKFKLQEVRKSFYVAPYQHLTTPDILIELNYFLNSDKLEIDKIIKDNKKLFETKQNPKNRIGFISAADFAKNLDRVQRLRKQSLQFQLPISLSSVKISRYGPIKTSIELKDLPANAQWIVFTGENGTGKTSILKALATACTNNSFSKGPKTRMYGDYKIELTLNKNGKRTKFRIDKEQKTSPKLEILTTGFVTFGPIRLNIQDEVFSISNKTRSLGEIFNKPHLPLFSTTMPLLDIGYIYNRQVNIFSEIKKDVDKRYQIVNTITAICDGIVDIHFSKGVRYFEVDNRGEIISPDNGTLFRNLASGYKSLIAMVSHMMLHLYHQQPDVDDPAELAGIVIIDEIDLHFHPKMQRDLVIKLTEIFPRIQFVVSTHSPIPLLGVPPDTPIFTVKINSERGVFVERTDEYVNIKELLPNSILTSPIFGLHDIYSESKDPDTFIRSETTFAEVKHNDQVAEKLKRFLNKKNTDEILKLLRS